MRLIDADALLNELGDIWNIPKDWDGDIDETCETAFDVIENAPTVEAQLVEWISMYDAFADTPYHNQSVLIKCDDGFVCSARFLISDKGNHCGFYHKHVGFLQCPQVVAWMPYNADMRKKVE